LVSWTFDFHEESFILAEKTQSAGIANSLTGDTLQESAFRARKIYFKNQEIPEQLCGQSYVIE